ncbi:MAG: hypothetical protein SOI64_00010 [Bifidobacterium mongoliense]|jgi:hypothetical protein
METIIIFRGQQFGIRVIDEHKRPSKGQRRQHFPHQCETRSGIKRRETRNDREIRGEENADKEARHRRTLQILPHKPAGHLLLAFQHL